jgi:transposase
VIRRLALKYSKEERLEIGRQLYTGEISRSWAAETYGVSETTAREYMRLYRDTNKLLPKKRKKRLETPTFKKNPDGIEEYESMSKEELIQELVKSKITEARLKKGYEVKGDGTVILYGNKNIK